MAKSTTQLDRVSEAKELAKHLHVVVWLEHVVDVIAQRVAFEARKGKVRSAVFSGEGRAERCVLLAEVVAFDHIGIA
jgi:hypothetical protein